MCDVIYSNISVISVKKTAFIYHNIQNHFIGVCERFEYNYWLQ